MFYRGEENQYKNNTTTATSIDSIIDKFLSADTIIQAPHDSQSYNRYSYVRNNPLVFTDPSGHSWLSKLWHHIKHAIRTIAAIVVAAVIAIYAPEFLGAYIHSAFGVTVATGALAGFASGGIMTGSLGGALKGALFGAISAGVAYGVAEVAGKLSGLGSLEGHTATLLKSGLNKLTAIKTMLHGLSRGIISKLQGGSFKAGFVSGLSSAFDIGTKAFGTGAGGFSMRTAVMAIVGGTASALGGGKFANGAISGAFVHMFNSEAYKFIRASLSTWKYGANGRYKTWLANGRDTGNSTNAPFEYYNGKSPGDRFFNGVGGFIAQYPDGVGLALSIGSVLSSGGVSLVFGGSALTLDIISGDGYGAGVGASALVKVPGMSAVDLAYGGCRANNTCSQYLDDILP